ncbi:MAG TPA: phosphatase PAP2 family protein [Thermoanaerobaculia bacterium]|nr:phosphatase PAP2 family protein [Thermoanaerobaculia bacterium]
MEARSLRPAEPLVAWPGVASLRFSLPLSYLFSKIFFSVYGGASLLAKLRGARPDFHFSWELKLPFVPSLAIVYLTVPLLLLLTPFILRTWKSFTPFFLTLTVETLIGGLFFLLLPMTQAYPERVVSGFGSTLFHLADRLNLDYNEFPSLHIAFAVTAAVVFGRRCGWAGRSLFCLWVVGVAVSTLFLHEHHILDLAGGAVLGLASVATVFPRTSRDETLAELRIEALCLKEFVGFVRRSPRYLLVFIALYRASLPNWRKTRLLRAAYCLAQHVDDVLDADRRVKGDPEVYVQAVLRGLRGEAPFGESAADDLAQFVGDEMRVEEKRELIELFEVLLADRRRMDARRVLSAETLAEHHRQTFFLSLDLTFRLAGAGLRAGDAPDLIGALSWVSPVRDLQKDWEKGLVNIPREALEAAGWTEGQALPESLLDAPAVREWLRSDHQRGAACIAALGARLGAIEDPKGRAILAAFHKALAAYERKYRRKNPDLAGPVRASMPGLWNKAG